MAILIAAAFPVLVLGSMDVPETAFAQYFSGDLVKSSDMAKERVIEEVLVCASEYCVVKQMVEKLEELRLPDDRQKLQSMEKQLAKLRPSQPEGTSFYDQYYEQAKKLMLDKRIELRLYDITYENKFLIMGVAVAVSGIVLVWRMGGKSIDKNR